MFSELALWLGFAIVGLYFVFPLKDKVRFGIDLVGGTYLTLEVQVDKAVETELVETMNTVDEALKTAGIALPTSRLVENNAIKLVFDSLNTAQLASNQLKSEFKEYMYSVEGGTLLMNLPENVMQRIKHDAVRRNAEVLRTRLRSEVTEISVTQQGERNIIVELPKTTSVQEEKNKIVKAAQLEFRIVEQSAGNKEQLLLDIGDDIAPDKEILSDRAKKEFYLLPKYTDMTGKYLKQATGGLGGSLGTQPVVKFHFTPEGGKKFYDLTGKNYGKRLAIVLDGVVVSAPTIQAQIGDSGEISGSFTPQEVNELALLLESGSFVAPVTFEEERQIGPTLGESSIRQGLISCLISLVLLFIFSVSYYRLAGFFAFLALLYNLALILMGIVWLRAALTLPGIAGMVLTIGMAIDASILIYERIREELARGTALKKAIDIGFGSAMKVILDSNITTFITGVVLYYFGTGPVKGFAITLMLGIIATLIAGLRFLKSLFSFILSNFNVQKISF